MSTSSTPPPSTGAGRYIIRSKRDEKPMAEFLGAISGDPSITVVDTIGPPGKPHTVIAEMSDETARSLQQRFHSADQLIIEPDRPLSLFPSILL